MGGKLLGSSKDVEALARIARAQKWQVSHTRGNHVEFLPPDKSQPRVITSLTPSDQRQIKNLKSRLRKAGLKL